MASVTDFQDLRVFLPATIANGASISGIIDVSGMAIVGLLMDPSAWTAAAVTFAVSDTAAFTNSYNLFTAAATELVIAATVTFGQAITFANSTNFGSGMFNALRPWRYIKVRSGTAGTPVAQGAQRNLQVVCLPQTS